MDHSFKIVQVQVRVIKQELDKGSEADMEMIGRALDTSEMTAHNGRDMLTDLVGRQRRTPDEDDGGTITGNVVR